jgi:hypothetical protein
MAFVCCLDGLVAADVANTATPHLQHVLLRSRDGHGQGMAANAAVSPSNAACRNYNIFFRLKACLVPIIHLIYKSSCEGIRGGYARAKQNFLPHKSRTTAVIDHEITTRRADAAEPSRCRRTRRG